MSRSTTFDLYLKDRHVGTVEVDGMTPPWNLGRFVPNDAFAEFESLFCDWSHDLHDGEEHETLPKDRSSHLLEIEARIDSLHPRLVERLTGTAHPITQINIHDRLVEWKEY